jgi:preprotein translocase subunit SecA
MGLFGWFRRKPSVVLLNDKIWLTTAAKLDGIREAIRERVGQDGVVVVAAHFPAALREARKHLEASGLNVQTAEGSDASKQLFEAARRGEAVVSALVETLAGIATPASPAAEPFPITIIVAERHLLRTKDDAFLPFAERLTPPGRIGFHLSLEDPVLRLFAGDWVGDVLRRLGMQESDAVESRMIARRIRAAQHKIAKLAILDRPADSAEEWVRLNCPELLREER